MTTPETTGRAVQFEVFGGPEVLRVRDVPVPQAGPGQLRVRVAAAGLNPMDWFMTTDAETAARFGLSLPCGFGTDYSGVVDQVGEGVSAYAVGDRVFGGVLSRAVADYVVVDEAGTIAVGGEAHRTPSGVDDRTAATLAIAGRTAAAAVAVVKPGPGDTVLVGGDRVRELAPAGVTAVMDLHGTDTAQTARELGVPDERITTIAAQVDGITPANGANAPYAALDEIAGLVAAGKLRVPIAAGYPVDQIRTAVELQAGRHVQGKIVIDL
ncbi:NADP-dependent oxidoreductase [Kribbella hippodromi]|uniref:NADP-dependent oxidoreductase n=1 Tax=Kribbella hippodromi TaxID=434347 RepID=A0ABN2E2J8_9ACTN